MNKEPPARQDRPLLIGVVHLPPLPGSPGFAGSMEQIVEQALEDSKTYLDAGFDGLLVENYGDAPFFKNRVPPATVAALSAVAIEITRLQPGLLGVNILRNDPLSALSVAAVVGARFIRVNVLWGAMLTDQGVIESEAADLLRLRKSLVAEGVQIWADLFVKHASVLAEVDPVRVAREMTERAGADLIILTGDATGTPPDPELARRLRSEIPGLRLAAGSGIDVQNVSLWRPLCDALIIGTSVKHGGATTAAVDATSAAALVEAVRRP